MLACPQCGGSVSATNHRCEFCSAELLVKACPRCFAKMFHGSKHCSRCGANVVQPAAADPEGNASQRRCPRCENTLLVARLIGDVLLDECPDCNGVFVDLSALEGILAERRASRVDVLLSSLSPASPTPGAAGPGTGAPASSSTAQSTGRVYVMCPDCGNLMNRRNFGKVSGVIVDVCRAHGTWFDANELPRVIEFAMKGGLESSRTDEVERMRREARRAEAARSASSLDTGFVTRPGSASPVGELLRAIGNILIR